MSKTSLYGKITSHVGGPWVLHLVDDQLNGNVSIREINAFLAELNPEEATAFWDQYPNLGDQLAVIQRVVVINSADFTDAKTTLIVSAKEYAFGEECLHRIHRMLFKTEYSEDGNTSSVFLDRLRDAMGAIGNEAGDYLILHRKKIYTGPNSKNEYWDEPVLVVGPNNRNHPDFIDAENQLLHFHFDGVRFGTHHFNEFHGIGFSTRYNAETEWPVHSKALDYTYLNTEV